LSSTRSPLPALWSVDELEVGFIVKDSGQKLAFIYFEEEPRGARDVAAGYAASNNRYDCEPAGKP
jgi:hypothetical protein